MLTREAAEKITRLQNDGADNLHVLSDFDRTLTKTKTALIAVLRENNFLSKEYARSAQQLFETYHPIEIDPAISKEIKRKKMEEWWRKHFTLLIKSGLTRDDIRQAMSLRHVQLREGAKEFFTLLSTHNIPLVIMSSSGLGVESITDFLKHENVFFENIHIISNEFIWGADGKAKSVKEPIIHVMNKDETLVSSFPGIFNAVTNRPNVLLLGDSPDDLGMVEGFSYNNLFSVGFGDTMPGFDLQLTPDASLEPVNSLLHQIVKT